MKYIEANPTNLAVKRQDWQQVYAKFEHELDALPAVKAGTSTNEDAQKWLECVCKTHSEHVVSTCIAQVKGLGAREIRALIAHDSGEYYPALSANEIYQSKQLRAFPSDFSLARNEEPFLINAVRQILTEQHGIARSTENEKRMLSGNGELWLRSKPSMYGQIGGKDVILDIHINRGKDITHSDELRLHYHNLVASSVGLKPQSLFQVNLQLDNRMKENLVSMASISPSAEAAAIEIVKEAIKNKSDGVEFSTRVIQQSQDMYDSLAKTGQAHWASLLNGMQIEVSNEKEKMPEELNDEYKSISKQIVVAKNLKEIASQIEENARRSMMDFAYANDITSNVQLPYEATTLRQNKKYDLQRLFEVLTNKFAVPANRLRNATIDTGTHLHLLEQSIKSGEPVTAQQLQSAVKYEGLNEASIKTAASEAGLALDDYAEVAMKVYFSGQKRGPVFDALQDIKQEVSLHTNAVVDKLLTIPELESDRLQSNLKSTGISHVQEF